MKQFLFILACALFAGSSFAQDVQISKRAIVSITNGTFHLSPSIALNTKSGNTLVVWERSIGSDHAILGRLLNNVGRPISGVFNLASGPNASHPSVVYNPAKNEFLLTYDDNALVQLTHTDVYVRRLNAKGIAITAAEKISTDSVSSTMTNFFPRVIFDPLHSRYLLFWLREVTAQVGPGNNGLVGAVLSATGKVTGGIKLIRRTDIEQTPTSLTILEPVPMDAVVNQVSGKLLLGFVQPIVGTNGQRADYYLVALDPSLTDIPDAVFRKVNASQLILSSTFAWGLRMAIQSSGSGYLVFVDSGRIRLRNINPDGRFVGKIRSAFQKPKAGTKLLFPALILTNGVLGERAVLIAVQDRFSETGQATLWAQSLDEKGTKIGRPVQIDITGTSETASEVAVNLLPHAADASVYPFLTCYKLSKFAPPGQNFIGAGLVSLRLSVTFP